MRVLFIGGTGFDQFGMQRPGGAARDGAVDPHPREVRKL